MTGQPRDRIVTGNISLSLDGRVTWAGGITTWAGSSRTP